MAIHSNAQRGAALLVVLIMLIVVGLAAVTGARDAQLQTRMSINNRAYEQAYYHAETSLAYAEQQLQAATWQLNEFGDGDGLFVAEKGVPVLPKTSTSSSLIDLHTVLTQSGKAALDAKKHTIGFYLIEYLGRVGGAPLNPTNEKNAGDPRLNAFRITALGQAGPNNKAWAVVQSELRLEPF